MGLGRKAYIVGINDYPYNQLDHCEYDACCMQELLQDHGNGDPNFHIIRETCATAQSLKDGIRQLFDCVPHTIETALFYFSGHGNLDSMGSGGLLASDCKSNCENGVSMEEILTYANQSQAINKIIILDCCHAGFMGNHASINPSQCTIASGVTILAACGLSERATEKNEIRHGLFTNLLLEGLRGGAADIRGKITPGSIYAYIDQALSPYEQRPVFKTNINRFISLRDVTPHIDKATLRKLTEYFRAPGAVFQLDPSYEFTNDPDCDHIVKEPYATSGHIEIFKDLQQFNRAGLLIPMEADHMYFAAMESKSCCLTPLGMHYWNMIRKKMI